MFIPSKIVSCLKHVVPNCLLLPLLGTMKAKKLELEVSTAQVIKFFVQSVVQVKDNDVQFICFLL